jgi:hypothetical protein
VRQDQTPPPTSSAATITTSSGERVSEIDVFHGPGKAGKPESQAVAAWPSSCSHMLSKMRAMARSPSLYMATKATPRAAGGA